MSTGAFVAIAQRVCDASGFPADEEALRTLHASLAAQERQDDSEKGSIHNDRDATDCQVVSWKTTVDVLGVIGVGDVKEKAALCFAMHDKDRSGSLDTPQVCSQS